MWKLAFLDVFDPSAENTDRHSVLFFAGHGAGMAADTAIVIDDEAVAHAFLAPSLTSTTPEA